MCFMSERRDDDPVERAVSKRRVTVIHIAQRNLFRNRVIRVQAAFLLESSGAFRYVASFFLALNTRHLTVPIGIAFAAAIS